MTQTEEQVRPEIVEFIKCRKSPRYFITHYCCIHNATTGEWVPFELWPEQVTTLKMIHQNNLVIVLKARQLGLTWLLVAYALWLLIFFHDKTVLLFSRRDDEAVHLLNFRLKGMYNHLRGLPLPAASEAAEQGRVGAVFEKPLKIADNSHTWQLDNGSLAIAFPTSAGDSYTASLAVVDEADLVPNLDQLLLGVKPTVDGGGRLVMISRSDKSNPASTFKKMYLAAAQGKSPWKAVFLPWWIRPERTKEWYEEQKADFLARTGTVDGLYEQYPETPEQALMVRSFDKRIPSQWLNNVYVPEEALDVFESLPAEISFPELQVFRPPQPGRHYVIGADPAEGNPTSDDSAAEVLDLETLEEVAAFGAPMQPTVFADFIAGLAQYYNSADALVERNNHGHAVIQRLTEDHFTNVLRGDDNKWGRVTSVRSKADQYNKVVDVVRPGEEQTIIHCRETYLQLVSVEGSTLNAPPGTHDDRAMAFGLAVCAADITSLGSFGGVHV